jgi:septal ring factor EnvC (AmiA/AmiB activator)
MSNFAEQLERELAQSQEANAGLMKSCDALELELTQATKQRDALAEALEDIRARCQDKTIELHPDSDAKGCVDNCLEWSEQALRSLTPNEP